MKLSLASLYLAPLLALATACGPTVDGADDDDDDGTGTDGGQCVPSGPENCTNVTDDDCNGFTDCEDAVCAGQGGCPAANCGELEHPAGSLALPDGEGNSYVSSINFTGFSDGQTLTDVTKLLGVCVNMEHSWLRDLQIEISCPTGQTVVMQMFLGQTGSEIYMGQPDDSDDVDPVPGVGAEYCWSPSATNLPMLDYVNANPLVHDLPPGDYQGSTPFSQLQNCPLNGNWTFKVTDLWASDNGFIFSWSIKFDPSLVEDCAGWPPIG